MNDKTWKETIQNRYAARIFAKSVRKNNGITDLFSPTANPQEINKDIENRKIKMHQMHRDEALEAFKIWENKEDKIKY